jgi:ankyrin repeat protein
MANHLGIVSILLEHGADTGHLNGSNITALHDAVALGRMEIIQCFLDHKANLEVRDRGGTTPLGWAVLNKREEIARLLIAQKVDVNAGDTPPLHWAVEVRSRAMAELLLQHGARMDLEDKWNRTPLSMAVGEADGDLATFLREHGAHD